MTRNATENLFVLLCAVIGSSLGIHLPQECEVNSELAIDYRGTDINFSVWVPDSTTEGFLTVKIEFEGYISPIDYDCATLYRSEVRFKRTRGTKPSVVNASLPHKISTSWADFTFSMGSIYKLIYHDNNMVLPLNASLDYKPKTITLKGSNITVNCPSNLRAWKFHESPVYVPLDIQEQHSFSFFSIEEFSPVISIEQRDNFLGMDNGSLTTVPSKAKPLPAFEEHHMVISCQEDNKCSCSLLVGKEKEETEDFEVGKIPKSVSIRAKERGDFFVILHGDERSSLQSESKFATCWKEVAFPVLIGILVLLILIISMLSFFLVKNKVCHGEKETKNTQKPGFKFFSAVHKKFTEADMDSDRKKLKETQSKVPSESQPLHPTESQDSAVGLDEDNMYRKSCKAYEEHFRSNREMV